MTDDLATTRCESDLYHFSYWYCLVGLIVLAVMLWIVILMAVGLCLGSKWLFEYLPDNIKNVRQKAEEHRRQMYRDE